MATGTFLFSRVETRVTDQVQLKRDALFSKLCRRYLKKKNNFKLHGFFFFLSNELLPNIQQNTTLQVTKCVFLTHRVEELSSIILLQKKKGCRND